jgi:hypothetical protein
MRNFIAPFPLGPCIASSATMIESAVANSEAFSGNAAWVNFADWATGNS